jgi:hypothetical protein
LPARVLAFCASSSPRSASIGSVFITWISRKA